MEITGVIFKVLPMEEYGKNRKQTIIIDTSAEYNPHIAVDIWNDKITSVKEGDVVQMDVNVSSKEYDGKWYTNVSLWKYATN